MDVGNCFDNYMEGRTTYEANLLRTECQSMTFAPAQTKLNFLDDLQGRSIIRFVDILNAIGMHTICMCENILKYLKNKSVEQCFCSKSIVFITK